MATRDVNLIKNVQRILRDIAVLVVHLKIRGLSNTAKSAYYRAVIVLASTVVEALVYQVISVKSLKSNPVSFGNPVVCSKKNYVYKQHIPPTITGGRSLTICEPFFEETHLDDTTCKLQDMNKFCKDNGYVTPREFRRLDYIRKKRNKIHVQGIDGRDRGYTMQQFLLTFEAINFLLLKI